MPIRHSVLSLYGAVSDALTRLNAPRLVFPNEDAAAAADRARLRARTITGLTGSTGEIGWYGELFRYFAAHPTVRGEEEPLTPTTLADAVAELELIGREGITTDEDGLQPSWASRAIEAAYVLDDLNNVFPWPEGEVAPDPVLDLVFAATPNTPGFVGGGVLGGEIAAAFADTIRDDDTILSLETLHARLAADDSPLHPAIGSATINPRLRKVKDEYCAVVSTSVVWNDITFDELKAGINPANWDEYFSGFFCSMDRESQLDTYGWTRIREEVSGECGRYRLRTPLKFWSQERGNGLFLNFDLDRESMWDKADKMVMVDNGYIWITEDPIQGVRIQTSKELLISGMSATALAVLARTMGYATNATDMFRKLAAYTPPPPLAAFEESGVPQSPTPPADNSATWPTVIPELPADIRDEMCKDTNDLLKRGFTDANHWFGEYSERWKDGIDADDFEDLTNLMSALLRSYTKEVFATATANFRPKPEPEN